MKALINKIKEQKTLLLDGAWGTMMHNKGLTTGECPELWNLTNREAVLDIARSYIDVGADIVETNSFGASAMKLELYGLADRAVEINKAAAMISREAAGADNYVFGSVGPSGKILMMGDVTEEQVYETFYAQCQALEEGGADAIIIETMSALDEALLALHAAKESTKLPVICSFTFEKAAGDVYRTMMGISPSEMASSLILAGADMIGTNCGNGFDELIEISREIRKEHADFPLLVQANAGLPQLVNGKSIFPESPEEMASKIPQLLDLGVNIIGGCCGTTPAYISRFARIIH